MGALAQVEGRVLGVKAAAGLLTPAEAAQLAQADALARGTRPGAAAAAAGLLAGVLRRVSTVGLAVAGLTPAPSAKDGDYARGPAGV
jgi:hypothetical protein